MSDDFDKQDDDFDWLSGDDGDDDSSSSSDSGLTGQLSWLSDGEESPDANTGRSQTDDLDLDWMNSGDGETSTPTSGDATGVTGELSWLSDQSIDDSPDATTSDTDALDWMRGDDDEGEQPAEDSPSWLSDTGRLVDDDDPEESPDWLANVGDTGMLNRQDINNALDDLDDEIDSAPDWLSNVGDTGSINRQAVDDALDDFDDYDDGGDEQPDWLTSMGIGSTSDTPDPDDSGTDDFGSPDWLSGTPTDDTPDTDEGFGLASMFDDESSDTDDEYNLETMFGVDDDDNDMPIVEQGGTAEDDTGWLEYQGDDDDEYDPYAKYNDDFGDDEEYEDIFHTDTLSDGEPITDNSLFDTGKQLSDLPTGEETPDWLSDFDEEAYEQETGSLTDDTADEALELDTGWLDEYEDEDFGSGTDALFDDDDDEPEEDTGWLDQYEDEDFGSESIQTPEPVSSDDAVYDVPDWLQGDITEGDTDSLPQQANPDDFADAPEMTADDLLANLGIDPAPSTGLTGDLAGIDDSLDDLDLDDIDLDDFGDLDATGLTGELDALGDDLLGDLDFDDLELDNESFPDGLTGELSSLDDMDMSFLDEMDASDNAPVQAGTGLTSELEDADDDMDMSFLDEVQVDGDRVGTGLTGDLDDADDDMDLSFLDEVQVDDEPERIGTGFTSELDDADDDMDLSFLDEVEVDDEPERIGTGFTSELDDADDDMDLSFLDEVEVDDEPERIGTGFTSELDDADDDMDLSFLDEVEVDGDAVGTGLTGELDDADEEMDLSFLDEVEQEQSATGFTSELDDADDDMDLSFLDEFEEDESATGFTDDVEDADEEMDLSFLDEVEQEQTGEDWFGEPDSAETEAEPDWMQTLSDMDVDQLEADAQEADMDDIFDGLDLDDMDFDEFEQEEAVAPPAADLESLLASYDDIEEGEFDIDNAESGIDDLGAIFDAALMEDEEPEDELPGDIPEWLRGVDVGSDETSAAAIIRQQDDKPLEDLDDRLQALRERGISASAQADEKASAVPAPEVLSDVGETLVAPSIAHETEGIVTDITLTDAQRKQSELLQQIVGVTITPTVETDEEGVPMVESNRRRRSLPKIGLGRLAVAVIILLVVILPFVSSFGVGSLPPLAFGSDNESANIVFNQLEALNDGDYVLVGFEYGPTAAGELDSVADILLRHIVSQGAIPVIVSSNPVGVVHAQNILNDINNSVQSRGLSLQANQDYYIVRYLTGGTLGLRDLSQNFDSIVSINAQGDTTNLNLTTLNDMALMLLIAEQSDDIRNWAEQVAPSTTTRLVAATGYSAQPLAEPYINQTDGILGLVVGYRDAFTYGEMLQAVYATSTPAPTETFTPTFTPTNTPEPTNTPLPTNTPEPTDEAESTDNTEDGGAQAVTSPDDETDTTDEQPTVEPTATNTPIPTDTPEPTATATNTLVPTDTPSPTATFTPTPRLITVIVVNAPGGSVNVRTGPNTNFPVLTTASDGSVYQVIGESEDGDWINFLLPDGRDGWIASFLVERTELPETDFEESDESDESADAGDTGVTVMQVSYQRRLGKNQVRYYQSSDDEATATPPFEVLTTPDPRADYVFTRDRSQETSRLNAMTLGTITAVVIILFGNIYFGLRAVLRRRREAKR